MLVCVCFVVSAEDIEDLVDAGFSHEEVVNTTGASMGCGACHMYVKNMCTKSEEKRACRKNTPNKIDR